MSRPTEREVKEKKIKNLIKDIWENECANNNDKITSIKIDDVFDARIIIGDRTIGIHHSSFDNYLLVDDDRKKLSATEYIKNILDGNI